MSKENSTKFNLKKFFKKRIVLFVLVILILTVIYFFFNGKTKIEEKLSQIGEMAQTYKNQNGNFGIITDQNDLRSCFAGNTFVKSPGMTNILQDKDVENISCVFKTASGTPIVEDWSITIVKGERAYCEDSTGDRRETPGLTTSHLCNLPQ